MLRQRIEEYALSLEEYADKCSKRYHKNKGHMTDWQIEGLLMDENTSRNIAADLRRFLREDRATSPDNPTDGPEGEGQSPGPKDPNS